MVWRLISLSTTDDSQVPPQQFRWLWGYTGHEQLDDFGLVNMNARLYDPKLGRLLSVDNYVSDPASPLAYNRYTYALNNPISYVDPSGNHPILVAMLIGAAISAATYTVQAELAPGGISRNFNIGDFASATISGAAIGAVTWGVGQAFNGIAVTGIGMSFVKEAGRAAAHGVIGGGFSYVQGGDFWMGFASGAVASFVSHSVMEIGQVNLGKVGGAFFSMGVGAGTSYMQGGNPWIGAGAALMSYTLNQLFHEQKNYIIVANDKEGASLGAGHNMELIGNDKDGYWALTKEGRDENAVGSSKSKSSNNTLSGGPNKPWQPQYFPSMKAFLADPNFAHYDRFIKIPIKFPNRAFYKMVSEIKSNYHVLTDNCTQAVSRSLNAGGAPIVPHQMIPNASFQLLQQHYPNSKVYTR